MIEKMNVDLPKVIIVMPAYMAGEYIQTAIDSILASAKACEANRAL